MPKFVDLTGQKFGRWTVVERGESRVCAGKKQTTWICLCECGNIKSVIGSSLKRGKSISCGCYRSEYQRDRMSEMHKKNQPEFVRHKEPLYSVWSDIKYRCYNRNCSGYPYYGGRGIKMCHEWKEDYATFRAWAISTGYRDGLSIDRIDVNGNYEPSNCRWATAKQQANNRRNNKIIEIRGESRTIAEWADMLNVTHSRIWHNINKGVTGEELLSKLGVVYG